MPLSLSFVVPVYNRPDELRELLSSMTRLEGSIPFEVVVVDDGSKPGCDEVMREFPGMNIHYYYKENTGPGDSRNYGMKRASGNYFIILDSDCLLSAHYLLAVKESLNAEYVDCFGGPDAAHSNFNLRQKAISFVMTSFWTTGGIRGNKRKLKPYEPRSFNMGMSKKAFEISGGFGNLHPGEDPELVQRLWDLGFKTKYIERALVYHKRRITWSSYARQIYKFGLARSILNVKKPKYASWVFWLPIFVVLLGLTSLILGLLGCFNMLYFVLAYAIFLAFAGMLNLKSFRALFMIPFVFAIQSIAYAIGFIRGWFYLSVLHCDPHKKFPQMFRK